MDLKIKQLVTRFFCTGYFLLITFLGITIEHYIFIQAVVPQTIASDRKTLKRCVPYQKYLMERYFTFWRRLGASLFDSIMLLPVSYFAAKNIDLNDPHSYFIWTALPVIVFIIYNVLLTGLAGQTIGKIVMGIKVLDLDEQSVIGIKRAFYRESVYFIIEIVGLLLIGYQAYSNGSISSEMSTTVNSVFVATHYCWIALELITMLFNSKRRAIHDFLASSVVISLRGQRFDLHYDQLERQRASL